MRDMTFFEQIPQIPVEQDGHRMCTPTFYYETTAITIAFTAPLTQVQKLLPSPQLKPLRMTPWHALVTLVAYEFRDTDIGPYNEVLIGFPVTVGESTSVFFGARQALKEPIVYIAHLPVTTEIARYAGAEFFGYPKFVAEIEFMREHDWINCHLGADGKDVLTLRARQLETQTANRTRSHALTVRGDHILRSELIRNPRRAGASRKTDDVQLELGNHPIADDLRALQLGRMLRLHYVPEGQSILTYAVESYAA